MADRMARLNALAQGGTAGLASFDQAQQSVAANNSTAIDRTLNYNGVGSGQTQGAQGAAQALVGKYTSGYTNDAAAARSNAGDQVGYDSAALDSFLSNQQKKLDQQRSQALQNEDLSQQQLTAQLASQQRKTDYYTGQNQGSSSPLAGLSASEQKALIEGHGQELQQNALTESQNAAEQAPQDQGDAASAALAAHRARNNPTSTVLPQGQTSTVPPLLQKPNSQIPMGLAAPAAQAPASPVPPLLQKLDPQQQFIANKDAEAAASTKAMYDNQAKAALNQTIQQNLSGYQQQSAIDLGMDPTMARGMYPADQVTMAARSKELATAQTQALDNQIMQSSVLDNATKLDLQNSGLSPSKVQSTGNALGMSLDDAAKLAGGDNRETIQQQLNTYLAEPALDTPEKKFASFSNYLDTGVQNQTFSPIEAQFWKQYFQSTFKASPSTGQLDTAATGSIYDPATAG